jgi:hypothetical protein
MPIKTAPTRETMKDDTMPHKRKMMPRAKTAGMYVGWGKSWGRGKFHPGLIGPETSKPRTSGVGAGALLS